MSDEAEDDTHATSGGGMGDEGDENARASSGDEDEEMDIVATEQLVDETTTTGGDQGADEDVDDNGITHTDRPPPSPRFTRASQDVTPEFLGDTWERSRD